MMLFNKKMKSHWGFTLIELMVGISIIGLLSSMVLGSVNQAREKAQNARTLTDVRQVLQGVAAFYADNGFYPACPAGSTVCCIGSDTCIILGVTVTGDVRTIANKYYGYIPTPGNATAQSNNPNTALAAATSLIPNYNGSVLYPWNNGQNVGYGYTCWTPNAVNPDMCDEVPEIHYGSLLGVTSIKVDTGDVTTPLTTLAAPTPSPTPCDWCSPTPTPEPTPEPTPSPTPCPWYYDIFGMCTEPTPEPSPSPSPCPEGWYTDIYGSCYEPTPTPEPSPSPTEEPTPEPSPSEEPSPTP